MFRVNVDDVPESQHSLFMRGFEGGLSQDRIRYFIYVRDFFTKEGGNCSFDFFRRSDDRRSLFVALRFSSKDVARRMLEKFHGKVVLGCRLQISYFKDVRRFAALTTQPTKSPRRPFVRRRRNSGQRSRCDISRSRSRSPLRSGSLGRTKSGSPNGEDRISFSRPFGKKTKCSLSGSRSPEHEFVRKAMTEFVAGKDATSPAAQISPGLEGGSSVLSAVTKRGPRTPPLSPSRIPIPASLPVPEDIPLPPDPKQNNGGLTIVDTVGESADEGLLAFAASRPTHNGDSRLAKLRFESMKKSISISKSNAQRHAQSMPSAVIEAFDVSANGPGKSHLSSKVQFGTESTDTRLTTCKSDKSIVTLADESKRGSSQSVVETAAFSGEKFKPLGGLPPANAVSSSMPFSAAVPTGSLRHPSEKLAEDTSVADLSRSRDSLSAEPKRKIRVGSSSISLNATVSETAKTSSSKDGSSKSSHHHRRHKGASDRDRSLKMPEAQTSRHSSSSEKLLAPLEITIQPSLIADPVKVGNSEAIGERHVEYQKQRTHAKPAAVDVAGASTASNSEGVHRSLVDQIQTLLASPNERRNLLAALSVEQQNLLQSKRREMEQAYRGDCETFMMVVKMLISKDATLEEKLLAGFRECLKDIGQKYLLELTTLVNKLITGD